MKTNKSIAITAQDDSEATKKATHLSKIGELDEPVLDFLASLNVAKANKVLSSKTTQLKVKLLI